MYGSGGKEEAADEDFFSFVAIPLTTPVFF